MISFSIAFIRVSFFFFIHLASIEKDAFIAQQDIEQINLMGNLITNVVGRAFRNLSKLKHINLSLNKIDHLNSDVFEGNVKFNFLFLFLSLTIYVYILTCSNDKKHR